MMKDQTHEQVQPLLAIYRDLNLEQQQQLQAHLEQCAACARELAEFQEMDRRLVTLREQQQRRFRHRQPDTAGLLAQIEAAGRPADRLQHILAPLTAPARVATAVIATVAFIAIAGLFVAWFSTISEGGLEDGSPLFTGGDPTMPSTTGLATTAASGPAARTLDPALQALREAGATVTATPNERWLNSFDDLFESDVSDLWDVTIDGEQAHIYAFDDEARAGEAAGTISRSADSLTLEMEEGTSKHVELDYVEDATPRYWRSGPFLIYYPGQNEATLTLLDTVFGPRIADGILPGQADRPGQGMAGGEWQGVTLQYDPYLAYDLRPEWLPSAGDPQQLWLHLESLNLHESAFAPALVISAEPINVGALVRGAPLTESEALSFHNGSGLRRVVETESGERVYVAEGERDDGMLYVAFYYPVLTSEDGYAPQLALLDALFSSLVLPDVLEPPTPAGTPMPDMTPTRAPSTIPGDDNCAAVQRPALVLARQTNLDRLNLTILDPLSDIDCTVSTQAYSPGSLVVSGNTLFYPRRDQNAGTITIWKHPLDGDPAPLPFTTTPAATTPWFGLALSPDGRQVVWATFADQETSGGDMPFPSTVWLGNLETGEKMRLWQEEGTETLPPVIEPLYFSAEENVIYLARRPYGIGGVGPFPAKYTGLYTLSLDGGEPQPLFECETPFAMCLNDVDFERRLITVAVNEGEQPALRILSFDGALVRHYTAPDENYVGEPVFGPDGSVAFITANLERPDDGAPLFRSATIRLLAPPYAGEPQTLVEVSETLFGLWHWLDVNHLIAGDWNDGQGLAVFSLDGELSEIPQSSGATPLLVFDGTGAGNEE